MAIKAFKVTNIIDGSTKIVKAETRGQVTKFMQHQFEISVASLNEVMEMMESGVKTHDAIAFLAKFSTTQDTENPVNDEIVEDKDSTATEIHPEV